MFFELKMFKLLRAKPVSEETSFTERWGAKSTLSSGGS